MVEKNCCCNCLKTTGAGVVTIGTALALGKTLAAVDGAAKLTLVIGAYVVAAGWTVETAEAKVESRSVCSTILCSGS